jgi:GNAT superfamily N-acetyltransferase
MKPLAPTSSLPTDQPRVKKLTNRGMLSAARTPGVANALGQRKIVPKLAATGCILMDAILSEPVSPVPGSRAPMPSLYPVRARLRDGAQIVIRPMGPEDADREQAFVRSLSPESRYFRFMSALRELPPDMLYRFTHPDFRHEVALVALIGEDENARQIGVARVVGEADGASAEFAVVVADDWQNRGVGSRLLCELVRAAHAVGLKQIWGDILATNHPMLKLMGSLGFDIQAVPEDPHLRRAEKKASCANGGT